MAEESAVEEIQNLIWASFLWNIAKDVHIEE